LASRADSGDVDQVEGFILPALVVDVGAILQDVEFDEPLATNFGPLTLFGFPLRS
jgi:hypothetical protein